jgi:hypothetical protein
MKWEGRLGDLLGHGTFGIGGRLVDFGLVGIFFAHEK